MAWERWEKCSHKYDDIIDMEVPTSKTHPRMSLEARAAQFSPFAALTGHDDAIRETSRITVEKQELGEDAVLYLNEQLNFIRQNIAASVRVTITYFVPDEKKTGGKYITCSGIVKKIDEHQRSVVMADNTIIPVEMISEIKNVDIS